MFGLMNKSRVLQTDFNKPQLQSPLFMSFQCQALLPDHGILQLGNQTRKMYPAEHLWQFLEVEI